MNLGEIAALILKTRRDWIYKSPLSTNVILEKLLNKKNKYDPNICIKNGYFYLKGSKEFTEKEKQFINSRIKSQRSKYYRQNEVLRVLDNASW